MIQDDTARAAETANVFDVVVMGCGISGLVAASVLARQGNTRILAIDEYEHLGGNHIDRRIGDYTFDVGSFIFQDDSPLLAHFPELLPSYVTIHPSWARLNPQGRVTQYPISIKDDLLIAGPVEWIRMMLSVVYARLFKRRIGNAREFARYWIGARVLRRTGLEKYLERFYGVPPDRIDVEFAEQRMQWIKEHGSLSGLWHRVRRAADRAPGNTQLARPFEGFAHLYGLTTQRLTHAGVTFRLGAKMQRIKKVGQRFELVADGQTFTADRVVSTIPIDRTLDLCGVPNDEPLHTVTLISLFFSFRGERNFDAAVLYNFSFEGAWKRLTVYSDFYGRMNDCEYFTVEVNADHVDGSVTEAEQDFRRHVKRNGLFDGALTLEGSHRFDNAYPIYTHNTGQRAAAAIAKLGALGVQSFGRQGGFSYQPTARASTVEAETALGGR